MKLDLKILNLKDFERYLAEQPGIAKKAAQLAINQVVKQTYAKSKREIMRQVNLKASYLDGRDGNAPRLKITKFATEDDLSAVIRGRQRATSLNRFDAKQLYAPAKNGGKKKAGVSVRIKSSRKKIPNAFFVKLRAGNTEGGNIGVAIRLKPGEQIRGRQFTGQPFGRNVDRNSNAYLLYGPSVQQVFNTVADDVTPFAQERMNAEFRRQYARLGGG